MFRDTDACVVGYGGIFPGGATANEFIEGIFRGQHFISNLLETDPVAFPFDTSSFYNADKQAEDQSYCHVGSFIDRRVLRKAAELNNIELEDATSMEVTALEAFRQALLPLKDLPEVENAEIIMGVSNTYCESYYTNFHSLLDETADALLAGGIESETVKSTLAPLRAYADKWDQPRSESSRIVVAQIMDRLKNQFGLNGPSCLIDAACASSLASVHVAIKRLNQGRANVVLVGGVDVVVNPLALTFFSKMSATSPEVVKPFDQDAQGINLGEGAGAFALMRLGDARAKGLKIHGVIRSCEGSSDGRTSAIVEPTVPGQIRAYSRAYKAASVQDVDFIEAHGTGTVLGDRTEINSLSEFFGNKKIHLGTVKALIGHACSAAGSAGMIKALGICQKRALPPSPYFKKFPRGIKTSLKVNTELVPIPEREEPITVGVSSLGFGGINFHMVLQEYKDSIPIVKAEPHEDSLVAICGSQFFAMSELPELTRITKYKIPPKSQARIDKLQRMGILVTEQTFKTLGIQPNLLDRSRVHVISASMVGTDAQFEAAERLSLSLIKRKFPKTASDKIHSVYADFLTKRLAKLPAVSEDTLSGFGNNVIAGRVANSFDFTGVNFNIDGGTATFAAGLSVARTLLAGDRSMVVLVTAEEDLQAGSPQPSRLGMRCTVLANIGYCLEHDLPLLSILKDVSYSEAENA